MESRISCRKKRGKPAAGGRRRHPSAERAGESFSFFMSPFEMVIMHFAPFAGRLERAKVGRSRSIENMEIDFRKLLDKFSQHTFAAVKINRFVKIDAGVSIGKDS